MTRHSPTGCEEPSDVVATELPHTPRQAQGCNEGRCFASPGGSVNTRDTVDIDHERAQREDDQLAKIRIIIFVTWTIKEIKLLKNRYYS